MPSVSSACGKYSVCIRIGCCEAFLTNCGTQRRFGKTGSLEHPVSISGANSRLGCGAAWSILTNMNKRICSYEVLMAGSLQRVRVHGTACQRVAHTTPEQLGDHSPLTPGGRLRLPSKSYRLWLYVRIILTNVSLGMLRFVICPPCMYRILTT